MGCYELVREIENQCARNQMRDVFFSEIETESPADYVRSLLKDRDLQLQQEPLADGGVRITAESAGLCQVFLFTPLDDE